MSIIVASNNKNKVKEIQEILKEEKIISLQEADIQIELEENGETFEENALQKAKKIAKISNSTVIADDTGLCIESLEGFPGVYTHRFLGEEASQEERNNAILEKLKGMPKQKRKAIVKTAIALVTSQKEEIIAIGEIQGEISLEKRGKNGFGFDEIFQLSDGKTLAELTPEEKNEFSSRKIALKNLVTKWKEKQ